MLRKTWMMLLCIATLLAASRASAITRGERDGGDHPNVGAMIGEGVGEDGSVEKQLWCSGTLISPTVFLTAAHCTWQSERDGQPLWVTFDPVFGPGSVLYKGTPHTSPGFNGAQNDPEDLAVIVLDEAVRGITPAALPAEGMLDRMFADGSLRNHAFTSVGYGLHERTRGGRPAFSFTSDRWRSVSTFLALNDAWLRLSQNGATGNGGTCYGDSGGPTFLGAGDTETPILVGTTTKGDAVCTALSVSYRLDTPGARAFLGQFVTLP